ncbi:MAG: PH domain-containing protein, partial [Candidatus Daviesbacteria bacterium]|nr:PH domain-containing protein [Candidatus Daviesbacteria bacterium]
MAKFHYKDSPSEKQKNTFKKYLSEDEELILVIGFSKAYIRSKFIIYLFFPGLLFLAIGLGLGWVLGFSKIWALILGFSLMFLSAILKTIHLYHANRYFLTTRRVIIKRGIFGVKITAVLFVKITNLEVNQSFFDRILLHHGTIIINTAG